MSPENTGVSRRALLRRTAVASGLAVTGGLVGAELAAPASSAVTASSAGVTTGNPSWLPAGLKNTYDPTLEVYNYKPSNTARHNAALQAAHDGTGTAVEVFLGDSSADGYTGTTFDRLAAYPLVYRNALARSAVSVPTSGTGWVRVTDVDGRDSRWVLSANWVDVLVVVYTGTAGAKATYTEPMAGTAVSVLFTAAAFATFTVSVDGATSGPGFLAFDAGNLAYNDATITLNGLPNTPHTVVITATNRFFFVLEAAMVHTPGPGLILHNMSQAGSKASGTGAYSWSDFVNGSPGKYFATPARYLQTPSTVWIALGANDAQAKVDATTVRAGIKAIAARFPQSDVFLVLEYLNPSFTLAAWTAFAQQLYLLADELDVPLFDQWAEIGGYSTYSANGLAGDTVGHLNTKGYAILGNQLAAAAALPAPSGGGGDPTGPPPAPGVNVVVASGSAVTLPSAASFPMNWVQLTADCALTFPAPTGGQAFRLLLKQTATAHAVTWPASIAWPGHQAPALSTGAGAQDLFTFVCLDGATWLGSVDGRAY